LFAGLSAKD